MDIGEIIALVLLGIVGLFVLVAALIGLGKGLKKTLGATVVIVLSIVIAFILMGFVFKPLVLNSGIISNGIRGLINGTVGSAMQGTDIATILETPSVSEAMDYYIYMIIAPFAFLVLFLVCALILGIVMAIVIRFIPIMNKIPPVAKRLGGLGVGLVNGFIVCLIVLAPIMGTVKVADTVVEPIAELVESLPAEDAEESVEAGSVTMLATEQTSVLGNISDIINAVVESPAGKLVSSCGGDIMYNSLASANYHGETIKLNDEVAAIGNVIGGFSSVDENDVFIVVIVDSIVEGMEGSLVVRNVAADFVSTAAQVWNNDEAFMGLYLESMGEMIDPMMDVIFEILATESKEYICDDLKSLSAFIHKVDERGLFDIDENSDEMMDTFGESGMISELLGTIENNERMIPLIDEVNCVALKIFATSFGIMDNKQALYDDLMQSLADTVNQYNNRMIGRDEAIEDIEKALLYHGIVITDEEADNIANALLDEYNSVYEDMPERIGEFFAIYLGTASGTLISYNDGKLTMGEMVFEKYNANNYRNSQAYKLAVNGKSIGKAETLFCAEAMETVIITADILYTDLVSYVDVEDRRAESEMIDKVMVALIDAYINIDFENASVSSVMAEMGGVLDGMHATTVYGDVIQDFLTVILQSDAVGDSLGMNVIEMTDFADSINNGVTEQTKYSDIANTVSQSVDLMDKVNSGEESKEAVQDLMKDITPDSAKVMQNITTPSLMQSYGVAEDKAEQSASAVSSLFGNMADYTTDYPQGDMSDEEYKDSIQKESEAVEKILTISIKATEDKEEADSLFTTEDGDGALDMSAYDVVDLFVTSVVVGDTLSDMVKTENEGEIKHDPLGIENQMTEQDKTEITDALNQYKANNADVEGIDEDIANIAALFGIVLE